MYTQSFRSVFEMLKKVWYIILVQPGMVLSMEPMLWIPEGQPGAGGYREHDCLVVHHDGSVENVTKFPFGPEHNIVK